MIDTENLYPRKLDYTDANIEAILRANIKFNVVLILEESSCYGIGVFTVPREEAMQNPNMFAKVLEKYKNPTIYPFVFVAYLNATGSTRLSANRSEMRRHISDLRREFYDLNNKRSNALTRCRYAIPLGGVEIPPDGSQAITWCSKASTTAYCSGMCGECPRASVFAAAGKRHYEAMKERETFSPPFVPPEARAKAAQLRASISGPGYSPLTQAEEGAYGTTNKHGLYGKMKGVVKSLASWAH